MRQSNSMRLHRMSSDISVVSDIRIVEISDLLWRGAIEGRGREVNCDVPHDRDESGQVLRGL